MVTVSPNCSKLLLLSIFLAIITLGSPNPAKPNNKGIILHNGKLVVTTEVKRDIVCVTLDGETTGYLAMGVCSSSGIEFCDVFTCGVKDNDGTKFGKDYLRTGEQKPPTDVEQNIIVTAASQNVTHTNCTVCRQLDTRDILQDLKIEPGKPLTCIWSMGEKDELMYHGGNRGKFPCIFGH